METYQYIIVVVVLLIIALSIVKMNKKDLKLELNKLVELLGGKVNVTWNGTNNEPEKDVYLSGPAEYVFTAEV